MSKDLTLLVAKVKRGSNRKKVLEAIEENIMPSELVKKIYGKQSNTHFNIVSRALSELRELGLIEIVNPEERTGRMYRLTKLGVGVKSKLNND